MTNISGSVEALPEASERYLIVKEGDADERTRGPVGQ